MIFVPHTGLNFPDKQNEKKGYNYDNELTIQPQGCPVEFVLQTANTV